MNGFEEASPKFKEGRKTVEGGILGEQGELRQSPRHVVTMPGRRRSALVRPVLKDATGTGL